MSWWGKIIGGAFGYLLGGPLGLLLGAALGHNFDAGLERVDGAAGGPRLDARERTQTAFFTATFSVMGHLSKADGRVTHDEIRLARSVMDHLGLGSDQRRLAERLFTEGKAADFPLDDVLAQLRRECRGSINLIRLFLEIQLQAAYADGRVDPAERRILLHVCERLHFPRRAFEQIEAMLQAELHMRGAGGRVTPEREPPLADAYALLGLAPGAADAEVKRAYRRAMSQHHPDKLVAKGLPEEMMKIATEKTQEIKLAYERIKRARGL